MDLDNLDNAVLQLDSFFSSTASSFPGSFNAWKFIRCYIKDVDKTASNKQSTPCICVNSCVATIYICKDCGGRVNSK